MNSIFKALKHLLKKASFRSKNYWEKRYAKGGNSGAGSYGEVAEFKARIVNEFISKNEVLSMVDWGCGDGNQALSLKVAKYVGIDVSPKAVEICRSKFKGRSEFSFMTDEDFNKKRDQFDLALSMDVLYHLVEDNVFEDYLDNLFHSALQYVIVFSTNKDVRHTIHHRDREFLPVIQTRFKSWSLISKIENPFKGPDSEADFYVFGRKD